MSELIVPGAVPAAPASTMARWRVFKLGGLRLMVGREPGGDMLVAFDKAGERTCARLSGPHRKAFLMAVREAFYG